MEIEAELVAHGEQIKTLFRRVDNIESEQKTTRELARNVDRLAVAMEAMAKEQAKQGQRLETLEQKPVAAMDFVKRQIVSVAISVIIGGALGALLALIIK